MNNSMVAIVDRYSDGYTLVEDDFNVKIARAAGLEPVLVPVERGENGYASATTKDVVEQVLATGAAYAIIRGFLWLADGGYAGCEVANRLQLLLSGVVCTGTSDVNRHPLVPGVKWECPPEAAARKLLTGRETMVNRELECRRAGVQRAEAALVRAKAYLEELEEAISR